MKGDHLVIPNLRKDIFSCIHSLHLGIEKTKQQACIIVFWPEMTKDIEEFIKHCHACSINQNSNQKEPLMPRNIHHLPREKVGCNLFYKNRKYYIITVDYLSRFFEIEKLGENANSPHIISCLKKHFAPYRIPCT